MKRSLYLLGIVILAGTVSLVAFQREASSVEGCITGQCHSTLLKAKNIHPVAETCDNCHQAVVTPHPQKDKKTFKLTQEAPDLCNACHPPFGKKQNVHSPVKSGMCTSCHNPHGADEAKLLIQPLKDLCVMCHADKTSHKYVHGPTATGDCTTCHNPHESDNKALVIKDVSELCMTCHVDVQEEMKKKAVHPAVLSGCTSCHNPHGSSYKRLLSAEGEKLCFQCHPQVGEKIEKSKSVHPPIKSEKACASCHSPHAGDGEKLLAKTGKDLCLDCHKGFLKKNQTVLHGPIKEGKCIPCHDPHSSPYGKLLAKEFPSDFYVPYNENEFQLCFSCHNRDLLRFPDTSFATGFRDGERNLHFLHVNKKEGRNCRACHLVHGGELPKLIADRVSFGKWNLPLNYVKSETGGSCAPGCHKKYNYDRKTPGKEPEPVKPKEQEKTKEPAKPKEAEKPK